MQGQPNPQLADNSITRRTLRGLQCKLGEAVGLAPTDISPADELAALIPPQDRRRVWKELGDAGYSLPSLGYSGLFWIVSLFTLIPLAALVIMVKAWTLVFCLPELAVLVRKTTRWLAIHPRDNLTVYETALSLSAFRYEDYQAGLWPAEDIADKVRLVISISSGAPFDSLKGETRIVDLC